MSSGNAEVTRESTFDRRAADARRKKSEPPPEIVPLYECVDADDLVSDDPMLRAAIQDLDIWIGADPENRRRAAESL